jgi:hypothetical protein
MLTGDWEGFKKRLNTFSRRLVTNVERATAENLQMVEAAVVGHLVSQDLRWKPLSARYLKRKLGKKTGGRLSEKILIATGQYRRSITSEQFNPFEGVVGVKKTQKYAGGEKVANIGLVHEFGTRDRRIPARPLWKPTTEELEERVVENYGKALKGALID